MNRPSDNLRTVGASGELTVRGYLDGIGWRVLEENFRCPAGELDLIAIEPLPDGDVLVFMEVKSRRGKKHGSPISAVGERKQARIVAAANAYLGRVGAGGAEPRCRFDIVEVHIGPDGNASITLHRGVFTA